MLRNAPQENMNMKTGERYVSTAGGAFDADILEIREEYDGSQRLCKSLNFSRREFRCFCSWCLKNNKKLLRNQDAPNEL